MEALEHENLALGNTGNIPPSFDKIKRKFAIKDFASLVLKPQKSFKNFCACHNKPISSSKISVYKATKGTSFFGGLQTCANVWLCPICGSKIQARRANEIVKFFDFVYSDKEQPTKKSKIIDSFLLKSENVRQGNIFTDSIEKVKAKKKVVMLTLTFPHSIKNSFDFERTFNLFSKSLDLLKKGNDYSKFNKLHGVIGTITAKEVTYGANGWHPHIHTLIALNVNSDVNAIYSFYIKKWKKACEKAGLVDFATEKDCKSFEDHAVDIQDNCSCMDYLTKSGLVKNETAGDFELTGISNKVGRNGSMTFFEIVDIARKTGELKYIKLIEQYALATKNKKQLTWSPGLKNLCNVDEKSDKELAEELSEEAVKVAEISQKDWYVVRKNRLQANILDLALAPNPQNLIDDLIKNYSSNFQH